MGIHHGECFVSSGINCLPLVYPFTPAVQVDIEYVLHFSFHEKDMLPRACRCMAGLWLKTVLYRTMGTGLNTFWACAYWMCNKQLDGQERPWSPGPRARPCQAHYQGQCAHSLPPAGSGPNVSISVRPIIFLHSLQHVSLLPHTLLSFLFMT